MFACRVPYCRTKYWDKTLDKANKHSMFKASSEQQLLEWRKILRDKGVNDFNSKHRICILHFKESDIERDRIIYQSGGIVSIKPRKVPLLTCTAIPIIFPSEIPTTVTKKRKLKTCFEHTVRLDPDTSAKQGEDLKRKISTDHMNYACDDVKTAKQIKTSILFQMVADMVHSHKTVSSHLNKLWIVNIVADKFIKWSVWTADRSAELQSINMYADLKVEVFMHQMKIIMT